MQSPNSFQRTEDEYFRLKGQLATGRITQAQFQAALKQLMIQDAQGRWWMLGAESSKWYVNDGQTWVEANPSRVAPATVPPLAPSRVYVVPVPTPVQPPTPTRSQRASSSGCCGPCLVVLIVSIVALVLLGAAFYSNMPQLRERAATAVAAMASPTPQPALNLCTLMPPGVGKTADKSTGPYVIPDAGDVYMLYPRGACYALFGNEEIRVALELYATSVNAQRVTKYYQGCPETNPGYTCTAISLGDGGFESESPTDPDCELTMIIHRLVWRRGCFVGRVEISTRPITPAQVKQLWDLARPLDAKLQTLPACPE